MIYVLAVAAIVAVDQFIKFWAVSSLQYGGSVSLIPGVVHMVYLENTGAAFGIMKEMRYIFVAVTVIGLAAASYIIYSRKLTHPLAVWSVTMLAGGAAGNLIDRAFVGYVVDMFEFSFKFCCF